MDTENIVLKPTKIGACRCSVEVQIPVESVTKAFRSTEKEVVIHAKLPGFRPGKMPTNLVRKRFSKEIAEQVKQALLQQGMQKIVRDNSSKLVTMPDIQNPENLTISETEPFSFCVSFDTIPEFELPEYKAIKVKGEAVVVPEEVVDNYLTGLMEARSTMIKVDRPSAKEDMLKSSYTCPLAGELEIPQNRILKTDETWLSLREPEIIPGIASGLIGLSAGDEKALEVEFPEDYHVEALRGKKTTYQFTIHEVHAMVVPELDDETAKTFGAEDAASLKKGVRGMLENQVRGRLNGQYADQICEYLKGTVDFELPDSMLQQETQTVLQGLLHARKRTEGTEGTELDAEKMQEEATKTATGNLRLQYLLDRIAEIEEIEVAPEALKQAFGEYCRMRPKEMEQMTEEQAGMIRSNLTQRLRMQDVLARLIELANIEISAS